MNNTESKRIIRSEKTLLLASFISIAMIFAGLTSGYVVRRGYQDWKNIDLPTDFIWSTLLIIASSIIAHWGYLQVKKGRDKEGGTSILIAALLGIAFGFLQYHAFFGTLLHEGYYTMGKQSEISVSYLFVIVLMHFLHIVGGVVTLLYMGIKALKGGYSTKNMHRLEIGLTFWHFLGFLWLYLFLFLHFFR